MQKLSVGKFHFKTSLSRFTSLDHLVGEQLDRVRYLNAECPRRLHVDDELELAGLQNRQVGGLRALEDSTGVDADLMPRVQIIGPITHQPSDLGKFTKGIDRGNPIARRERRKLHAPADEEALTGDIEGVGRVAPKAGEGGLDFAAGAGVEHSNLQSEGACRFRYISQRGFGNQSIRRIDQNGYTNCLGQQIM